MYHNILNETIDSFMESDLYSSLSQVYKDRAFKEIQSLFFKQIRDLALAVSADEQEVEKIESLIDKHLGNMEAVHFAIGFRFAVIFTHQLFNIEGGVSND